MAFQSVTLPYMERGRWGCGTPALNCTYRQHKYVCMKDSLPIICNEKEIQAFAPTRYESPKNLQNISDKLSCVHKCKCSVM